MVEILDVELGFCKPEPKTELPKSFVGIQTIIPTNQRKLYLLSSLTTCFVAQQKKKGFFVQIFTLIFQLVLLD